MKEAWLFDKFIKRTRARFLYHNQNWLAIICGETGSGKSYSAVSLAKLVGKRFYIVFTPIEFLRLLNSNRLGKGDIIIFDEAGVGMSSREWYSQQNKLLGTVLQTFRNMNVGVIFTTPNLSFIDIQARKLFHNYFETAYLDYENEEAYLKCYDIQVNSMYDKIYYKKPKFQDENGGVYTMSHLVLDKPDDQTIKYYESRKSEYTKKLNENALKELTEPKNEAKRELDLKMIGQKVISNKDKYCKEYKKRKFVDTDLLRNDFGLSITQAKLVKREVENKLF